LTNFQEGCTSRTQENCRLRCFGRATDAGQRFSAQFRHDLVQDFAICASNAFRSDAQADASYARFEIQLLFR
jgi:hypothetical protein